MTGEIKIIGWIVLLVILVVIVSKRFGKILVGENPDKGSKKFFHIGGFIGTAVIFILALPYNFVYRITKYFLSKKLKDKTASYLSIPIAVVVSIPIYLGIWAYVPTLY